ncbi:MAG: phage holin [Clostridia bacterium]|nr:phage holin [Clostridia bacterium]
MKINWKVRIKNKMFWMSFIPALLLCVQVVASVFGVSLDMGMLTEKLLSVVNAAFSLMVILGVVTDPTTAGLSDSKQALTYEKPRGDTE